MKHILITTIAAVVLVGCGESMSIYEAANKGKIKVVKRLLAAGADVNTVRAGRIAALHYAAKEGHKEIVELLINKGAHMNVTENLFGYTPLDWAIEKNHTETADLLRKHGGKTAKELKAEGK